MMMSWKLGLYFKMEVQYRKRPTIMHGYVDYGLWYGEQGQAETNLIVVEAKRRLHASSGETQLLGYMGKWQPAFLFHRQS